jgi:hypothetical protein
MTLGSQEAKVRVADTTYSTLDAGLDRVVRPANDVEEDQGEVTTSRKLGLGWTTMDPVTTTRTATLAM